MTTAPTPYKTPSAAPAKPTAPTPAAPFGTMEYLATTPGRMQSFAALIGTLSLLLWLIAQSGLSAARQSMQTIGKDAAPSIVAAEKINASLADMDANAANGFLANNQANAAKLYQDDRLAADDALTTAAQNITFGAEERGPILAMTDDLQQYVGLIEQARLLGKPGGLVPLKTAYDLMHGTLIPAAKKLDEVNFAHLNASYNVGAQDLSLHQGLILFGGALLLTVLVAAQLYVLRKTRRLINLPMTGATLLTALFVLMLLVVLTQAKERLRAAKVDGFESIHALSQLRAAAYDANGDETQYLLVHASEPGVRQTQRAAYTQNFQKKTKTIADTAPQRLASVTMPAAGQKLDFTGFMADELNNITFEYEKEAAEQTAQDYAHYLEIDRQIRQLEETNQSQSHDAAVALCTGFGANQSNGAFKKFDESLQAVLDINQKEFDKTVTAAFATFKWAMPLAPVLALLIAFCAWFGCISAYESTAREEGIRH